MWEWAVNPSEEVLEKEGGLQLMDLGNRDVCSTGAQRKGILAVSEKSQAEQTACSKVREQRACEDLQC